MSRGRGAVVDGDGMRGTADVAVFQVVQAEFPRGAVELGGLEVVIAESECDFRRFHGGTVDAG